MVEVDERVMLLLENTVQETANTVPGGPYSMVISTIQKT